MQPPFLRATFATLGCVLILFSLNSCSRDVRYYTFKNVQMHILNSPSGQDARDNDTCKIDSSRFFFQLNYQVIAQATGNNWNLIGKANAYKPAPPIIHSLERLKDIKFYTVNNFNANYGAGSDISELVTIPLMLGNDTTTTPISIQEFVQKYNENQANVNYEYFSFNSGQIRFTQSPNMPAFHQFAIEVITEKDALLIDTSVQFYLMP